MVRKNSEIFIIQCDLTSETTQLSSVTQLSRIWRLLNPHWKNKILCKRKNQKFEIKNGLEDAPLKSVLITSIKKVSFFWEHAGKIFSTSVFCPSKCPFRLNTFASFEPIFGRTPSYARIRIKHVIDLNISKFWISNAPRILPSEEYFKQKSCLKKSILPVKRPFTFASFDAY